ncbi:uncharacterized protein J4E87_003398 [Alternaria ethzedia]|uniref:uncharacterized protein n=1 Tax=Alternaria ethzedia TaxID=181014 RepID=UPI0020C3A8C9|nr:uncharacterized protein J4E87_003398 [Alternaria ethzedia]KAI4629137.1 hypothetical protein J4E87_003398 [Alternaria ethzedia]
MGQHWDSREETKTDRYGMRRERDVLLLYGAAFRNIPQVNNLENHVPRLSLDSTLTALCQLTAIRMGAQRSMISLIDDERQHILAEATRDLPLRPEAPGDAPKDLWLGNVSTPRSWGICEKVLELDRHDHPVFVINDLTTDQRTCLRTDVQGNSDMRFYASVALMSPNGAVVGTLCIFDNKAREGVSKEELTLFKDLGSTVINYLNTYTIRDKYRRGEKFTRGLVSFAEGASSLAPFEGESRHNSMAVSQTLWDPSSTSSRDEKDRAPTDRAKTAQERDESHQTDSILPTDSKSMFSRAANLLMSSSDLDGVLILDASVAASGGQRRNNSASRSGTEAPSESYRSRSSSDEASSNSTEGYARGTSSSTSKMCQLLGVATPSDKEPEYGTLLEPDLSRLFHEYPHGKIFTFSAEGDSLSSSEETVSSLKVAEHLSPTPLTKRKTNDRTQRGSAAIQAMFPKARSIAFIPFWDFERSRWFAGSENAGAPTAITLTITDTGSGMSSSFLANRLFHPFSQENPHAPGTGLGMSIVRQIIDTNGGKVEVSSDRNVGTKLIVKLALARPEVPGTMTAERAQFLSYLPRLEGRRICILRKTIERPVEDNSLSKTDEGLLRFTNALVYTLETHLKMEVVKTNEWEGHDADMVICPELSFDYLATIRKRRPNGQRAPVTIFVGMDALEAATLRSDVRVTNRESVVEIITQPCGPYKLAWVLNRCLDRYEHPAENLQPTGVSSPPPQPMWQSPPRESRPSTPMKSMQSAIESLDSESPRPIAPSTAGSTVAQASVTSPTSPQEDDPVISHTLIVDDNPLNRRLLVAFMKKNGLQFDQASNGQEAVDKYRERPRKYDVILMDMSMPVMDGMSATRAIREYERNNKLARCSIVALTGLASSSAKLEAWSSGIDHFMTKPVNFKALGDLLKSDEVRRHARPSEGDNTAAAADIPSEECKT